MTDRIAEQVILIDGPMAGHLRTIPEDMRSWVVHVPRPISVSLMMGPEPWPGDDTAIYSIAPIIYQNGYGPYRHPVRVGWTAGAGPAESDLLEHVPTGLAEQGVIPWDHVTPTKRDRAQPIRLEAHGDPLKACKIDAACGAVYWIDQIIDASCACGWRTDRVARDRRSQLQRAVHWHALDEAVRRKRYHEPIRIVFLGGFLDDCYGGIVVDERAQLVYGLCRICGWQTERVEYARTGPLRDLCKAHTGPDGVRRVRDRLLAAYGLPPAPPESPPPTIPTPAVAPAGPYEWGVHDSKFCADTIGSRNLFLPVRCIDGTVYGMCGPNCYGTCEDQGACGCACHTVTAARGLEVTT